MKQLLKDYKDYFENTIEMEHFSRLGKTFKTEKKLYYYDVVVKLFCNSCG